MHCLPPSAPHVFRRTAIASLLMASAACASMNSTGKGAVVGTAAGAAIGGVIGNNTGSTARGAIIGAVVGGAAGALIGHQMDNQADELKTQVPGGTVERVGEGIQMTFASGLLYDFDSDAIKSDAATNLQSLAESLLRYPETELLIVGHTDAQGSTAYNQALSSRRADAASSYLVSRGVAASRLHATGKGEAESVASNDTEVGRAQNRRIEVAIYAAPAARAGQ